MDQLGEFDTWFYAVQAVELSVGAMQLTLLAMNFRDGLALSGKRYVARPKA